MHRRESTANDDDQPHGDDFQRSEEAVGPRDGNERRVDPSAPPPPPPTSPHEQSRSEEYDEHYGDLNIGENFNRSEEPVGIRDGNVRRTDPSTVPPTQPPGNERLGSPSRGAGSAGGSEETGGLLDEGGGQSGDTSLLVGELHWWTTDADLEAELCKYGRVKEIKFDVWDNGKSNGMCIVDFYDPLAAAACKDGMNGHVFNDRPCVVEWARPPTVPRTLALPAQPRGSGGGDGSMLPCPRVAVAPPPPPAAAPPPPPAAAPPPPAAAPVNLVFFGTPPPPVNLTSMLPCLLVAAPPPPVNPSFIRLVVPSPPLATPPPPVNLAFFEPMLPCLLVTAPPPSPPLAAPPPPPVNLAFFEPMLPCLLVTAPPPSPPLAAPPPPPPMNQASFGSMLPCSPIVALPPSGNPSFFGSMLQCPPVSAAPLLSPIVNPAATYPPVSAAPLSPTVNPAFFGSMLQWPPVSSAAPLSPPTVNPAAPCPPVSAAARSPPTVNPAFLGSETTSAGAAEMWLNPGIGERWGVEEQPSKGEDSVQQGEASNEKKDRAKPETDRETQRDTETGRSRSREDWSYGHDGVEMVILKHTSFAVMTLIAVQTESLLQTKGGTRSTSINAIYVRDHRQGEARPERLPKPLGRSASMKRCSGARLSPGVGRLEGSIGLDKLVQWNQLTL
ncbi:hypothetical protein C4D60_Mb08t25630 [Musa balbisiana]|uniref:RRM domain-containing protein n=1 Tax=Musa balbisiana TaxID=52838 RepID=A0A4S8K6F3_MUSBA|nr:hypothetical protein C4D60_Mb08t25630 [Musa balbisiana]